MSEQQDFATLLQSHLNRRFGSRGSQQLARRINERFVLEPGVDFISRNTIDNWLRGYVKSVREWEKLAAVAAVLDLSESEADELLRVAGQVSIARKRLNAERAIERQILATWSIAEKTDNYSFETSLLDEPTSNLSNVPLPVQLEVQPSADYNDDTIDRTVTKESTVPIKTESFTVPNINKKWNRFFLLTLFALLAITLTLFTKQQIQKKPLLQTSGNGALTFTDNFNNANHWDLAESVYAKFVDGQLWFDIPKNQTGNWLADVVNPQHNVGVPISKIRFTVELQMSTDQDWGYIGLQTECFSELYSDDDGNNDWLLVYIGGSNRSVWVEYTPNEDKVPHQNFMFDRITTNQPYLIDLLWSSSGVQIYVDNQPQGSEIPCLQPRQFNLNAGLDPGASVKGYVDDFQLWQ